MLRFFLFYLLCLKMSEEFSFKTVKLVMKVREFVWFAVKMSNF